jgi:hypothetical protein
MDTYWEGNGKHQNILDKYSSQLSHILSQQHDDLKGLEALRRLSNIYYDIYNNGGINLKFDDNYFTRDFLETLFIYNYPDYDKCVVALGEFVVMFYPTEEAFDKLEPILEAAADFVILEVDKHLSACT